NYQRARKPCSIVTIGSASNRKAVECERYVIWFRAWFFVSMARIGSLGGGCMRLEFCNTCLKWHEAGNCPSDPIMAKLREEAEPRLRALRDAERNVEPAPTQPPPPPRSPEQIAAELFDWHIAQEG